MREDLIQILVSWGYKKHPMLPNEYIKGSLSVVIYEPVTLETIMHIMYNSGREDIQRIIRKDLGI